MAATSNTAYGIINDAMVDAGYLQEGEQPNSEQLAMCLRRLCDIVNLWQTQGLKLFLLEDISIPLVSGQSLYSMGLLGNVVMPKPSRILQGYVLDTVGLAKRPLTALSWNEWMLLSMNTGSSGTINSYFVDKQPTLLNVHVWQTPDTEEATNTLHLLTQVQAENPVNLEDNMIFPQEWRIALRWGLADDIATGQPQAIMDRCAQRSVIYREMLENWDVEDAPTRFSPDSRMAYSQRFGDA